jgi:pimeloyl-ACP methyl ester carboxylesterase
MVLVDPIHAIDWLQMTEEGKRKLAGAVRLSRYGALLARLGVARFVSFLVGLGASGLARFSVSLVTGGTLADAERMISPAVKLPSELRPIVAWFWTQPKFFEAIASQAELLPRSAAQVAATGDYGDMPLVVLSASGSYPSRMKEHEALARLSSRGRHIVASKSGHWIQLDEPDLVVESIREVVGAVRRRLQGALSGRSGGEGKAKR